MDHLHRLNTASGRARQNKGKAKWKYISKWKKLAFKRGEKGNRRRLNISGDRSRDV